MQAIRKALFATSRKLHIQVRESITKLTINIGQLELLKPGHLPALKKLTLRSPFDAIEMLQLTYGTWQTLVTINLFMAGLDYACLLLMVRGSWPMLKHLQLSYNNLRGGGMAAAWQLVIAPIRTQAPATLTPVAFSTSLLQLGPHSDVQF